MKPEDTKAALIQWGIELETRIPQSSGVTIGGYHNGFSVTTGVDQRTTLPLNAPKFRPIARSIEGSTWKAERDGSIRCDAGQM